MSADFRSPLPHQVALPTEAWQGAEIRRRSVEKGYVDLPRPIVFSFLVNEWRQPL
jgi:hypothetical protein